MIVIGPGLGTVLKVEDKHIGELDVIYQKSQRPMAKAIQIAQRETELFVKRVTAEYQGKAKKAGSSQT